MKMEWIEKRRLYSALFMLLKGKIDVQLILMVVHIQTDFLLHIGNLDAALASVIEHSDAPRTFMGRKFKCAALRVYSYKIS